MNGPIRDIPRHTPGQSVEVTFGKECAYLMRRKSVVAAGRENINLVFPLYGVTKNHHCYQRY
jgi:hypothetical protein